MVAEVAEDGNVVDQAEGEDHSVREEARGAHEDDENVDLPPSELGEHDVGD